VASGVIDDVVIAQHMDICGNRLIFGPWPTSGADGAASGVDLADMEPHSGQLSGNPRLFRSSGQTAPLEPL